MKTSRKVERVSVNPFDKFTHTWEVLLLLAVLIITYAEMQFIEGKMFCASKTSKYLTPFGILYFPCSEVVLEKNCFLLGNM